ncbi:hypothetical protein TMatcc_008422 [Talaromyces marneffei ATCC 18224]
MRLSLMIRSRSRVTEFALFTSQNPSSSTGATTNAPIQLRNLGRRQDLINVVTFTLRCTLRGIAIMDHFPVTVHRRNKSPPVLLLQSRYSP